MAAPDMGSTRRQWMESVIKPVLLAKAGLMTGVYLTLSPRPAEAIAPAGLAAAATAAQLIGSFMRGDDGMGAMMNAINKKLDLIVEQLALVHVALAEIKEKLILIPEEIDERLKKEFVVKHISTMKGAIGEYLELQRSLEPRRQKRSVPKDKWDAPTTAAMRALYERFNAARRDLMESPHGARPDSAVFAPAAFMFDMAMQLLSGVSDRRLIELARGYVVWYDRILDPTVDNSTVRHIAEARDRHQSTIKALASTHIGAALGFKPPSPPDLTPSVRAIVGCVDATRETNIFISHSQGGSSQFPVALNSRGRREAATLREKIEKLSPDYSVKLFDAEFTVLEQTWPSSQRPATVESSSACSTFRTFSLDLEAEITNSRGWREHLEDRAAFLSNIELANAERLRIGAYSAIFATTAQARRSGDEWIKRLGG